MKKLLAVVAVITVVCAAGAAFAQTRGRDDSLRMPFQMQQGQQREMGGFGQRMPGRFGSPEDFDGEGCRFMGRGFGHRGLGFAPDMPEEIRTKVVEAAKLRIDLEEVLSRRPVDKAKAMEVFAKVQQAENEIETWRFGNMLERMEKAKIMRELNKISRPAPKTGAPAPAE